MCDFCNNTGMIHVLRFYDCRTVPYEMVEPCFCGSGSMITKSPYRFQKEQIGNHYKLVRRDPLVFVDDRLWSFDSMTLKSSRVKDKKVLTKDEIDERLKVDGNLAYCISAS